MVERNEARHAAIATSPAEEALHPAAWVVWLMAASVAAFLTSNPLYLSIALLASLAVYAAVADPSKGRGLGTFVKLGLALAALSVPFNVLTGSAGPTELASLPEVSSPRWFGGVTLGGPVTGEALVSAAARALGVATLIVLASAFNSTVDHVRLLRLAPRGFAQLMLTMSLALLVVPQAAGQARAVAEAQRLRGRRVRGVRSLALLLLPTLQGALERAVQRAESLDARGFGGGGQDRGWAPVLVGVAGLGLCAWGAFAHFYYGASMATGGAIVAGAALVAMTLVHGGATGERYRVERWTARDVAVMAAAIASLVLIVGLRATGAGDAGYLPYPEVVAPAFHPAGAMAFLLLLAPAVMQPAGGEREETRS